MFARRLELFVFLAHPHTGEWQRSGETSVKCQLSCCLGAPAQFRWEDVHCRLSGLWSHLFFSLCRAQQTTDSLDNNNNSSSSSWSSSSLWPPFDDKAQISFSENRNNSLKWRQRLMETFNCCVEFTNNSVAVWSITFHVFYRLTDVACVAHIFGLFTALTHSTWLILTLSTCASPAVSAQRLQMELLGTAGAINQMCIVAVE